MHIHDTTTTKTNKNKIQQTNNEATRNTQKNNTNILHQRITCEKSYNKKTVPNNTQSIQTTMQTSMEKRKRNAKNLPNRKMQRNIPNNKKCQTHTQYRCHHKNINKTLNLIKNKTIDRRTIQGRGTPKTEENIYHKRITYNIEINKWICNTCGKRFGPKNQKNAIQHACAFPKTKTRK